LMTYTPMGGLVRTYLTDSRIRLRTEKVDAL